jgi:hypothetical protein
MSEETPDPKPDPNPHPVPGESPGGTPMGFWGVTLVTLYLVLVTVVVFHSLVVLWPLNATALPVPKECGPGGQFSTRLFFWMDVCLSDEERLFLIVMFAGALGGLVHALRSFYWYAGCRKLVLSWTGFYVTLPVLGAAMATIFYLVVRGGLLPSNASTSPFGYAAMAVLTGMFTEQAAMKLKQILETILAEAPKGTDHAGEVSVKDVKPNQGPKVGSPPVTISGAGFAQNAGVTFGGLPAKGVTVAANGASLTATPPDATAAGPVTVEVNNPGGKKGSLVNGYTYV